MARRANAKAKVCLADCIALTALALQREFAFPVFHHQVLGPSGSGEVDLIFAQDDAVLAPVAGRLAVDLVATAVTQTENADGGTNDALPAALPAALDDALERLRQVALLPATRRTLWKAESRGIPWARLPRTDGVVQLGQGHKLKRLRGSYLQDTSYLAVKLAGSKVATAELLRGNGFPVPKHFLVTEVEAAVTAAQDLGYPVVVKPNSRDMGTAVTIDIFDAEGVRSAFATARSHGSVLVEQQVSGLDCRVTVLQGKMIGAAGKVVARVIGDGRSTIQELIDAVNRDPRRSNRYYSPLNPIVVQPRVLSLLARKGYDLQSVPAAGEAVPLRPWWRQGGDATGEDLTAVIHPANQALAERAARLVGLDFAGVDLISPDITRPWHEVGGYINEINPTPGLTAHVRAGAPDVHRLALEALYPPGDDGRIPFAVLLPSAQSAATARLVARMLQATGHSVGLATRDGVEIAGTTCLQGDAAGPAGARIVLNDPLVTAGVLELSESAIERDGLGFDRAPLVAVLDRPKSVQAAALLLEFAGEAAILNADLPGVADLAPKSAAKRLCLVAQDAGLDRAKAHAAVGGSAVTIDDDGGVASVCLWDRGLRHAILPVADAGAPVVLFAVAIAHGLGVSRQQIAEGLNGPKASPSG